MKKITGKRILGLLLIITALMVSGISLINQVIERLPKGAFIIIGVMIIGSFLLEQIIVRMRKEERPFKVIKNNLLWSAIIFLLRVAANNFAYILGLVITVIAGLKFELIDYLILLLVVIWAQILGGFTHHISRIWFIYQSRYDPEIDIGEDVH